MKTLLLAATVAAFATPALAQTTTAPAPVPAAAPVAADPAAPQTDPSAATTAPAAAVAPSDPKAIIASEFPTYDKDGNGQLSKVEFDTWLTALKDKSGGEPLKPAAKTSWLKTAFTTADKDKSKGVSLPELTDYLTAQG